MEFQPSGGCGGQYILQQPVEAVAQVKGCGHLDYAGISVSASSAFTRAAPGQPGGAHIAGPCRTGGGTRPAAVAGEPAVPEGPCAVGFYWPVSGCAEVSCRVPPDVPEADHNDAPFG